MVTTAIKWNPVGATMWAPGETGEAPIVPDPPEVTTRLAGTTTCRFLNDFYGLTFPYSVVEDPFAGRLGFLYNIFLYNRISGEEGLTIDVHPETKFLKYTADDPASVVELSINWPPIVLLNGTVISDPAIMKCVGFTIQTEGNIEVGDIHGLTAFLSDTSGDINNYLVGFGTDGIIIQTESEGVVETVASVDIDITDGLYDYCAYINGTVLEVYIDSELVLSYDASIEDPGIINISIVGWTKQRHQKSDFWFDNYYVTPDKVLGVNIDLVEPTGYSIPDISGEIEGLGLIQIEALSGVEPDEQDYVTPILNDSPTSYLYTGQLLDPANLAGVKYSFVGIPDLPANPLWLEIKGGLSPDQLVLSSMNSQDPSYLQSAAGTDPAGYNFKFISTYETGWTTELLRASTFTVSMTSNYTDQTAKVYDVKGFWVTNKYPDA